MSEFMPDRMSAFMSDRMTESMSNRMSEFMPGRMSAFMSNRMTESMSDRMSEFMPDRMSAFMSNRMTESMPDRMSEFMPDKMGKYVTDRMVNLLPTLCQIEAAHTQPRKGPYEGPRGGLFSFSQRISALWVKTTAIARCGKNIVRDVSRKPCPKPDRFSKQRRTSLPSGKKCHSHPATIDPKKPLELSCCFVGGFCRWWMCFSFVLLVDLLVFLCFGPFFGGIWPSCENLFYFVEKRILAPDPFSKPKNEPKKGKHKRPNSPTVFLLRPGSESLGKCEELMWEPWSNEKGSVLELS